MTNLIRWNPFEELENFFPLRRDLFHKESEQWLPKVNISETKDNYIIRAELPAVQKEDIKLHIDNGVLVLEGERQSSKEEKDETFHRIESSYGSFRRSFNLPDGVSEQDLEAHYKDGVLNIQITKKQPTEQSKAIDIKIAQ